MKFLKKEAVLEGYWQKTTSRGRPCRMYHVNPAKLELATQLAALWQKYQAKQTKTIRLSSARPAKAFAFVHPSESSTDRRVVAVERCS